MSKINELKKKIKLDYLQVFELEPIGKGIVIITYRQEVPAYEEVTYIVNKEIDSKIKIFVIDSVEYSTMVFSHEY